MLTMEYWTSYKAIAGKMKKRFMRKPNYGEAAEQYLRLAKTAQSEGSHQIAAFCFLAVARCEEAIGDSAREARYTRDSAHMQLSEVCLDTFCSYNTFTEHVSDAINTYLLAVELYKKENLKCLASFLLNELASVLQHLALFSEATIYYEKCLDFQTTTPVAAVNSLYNLYVCKYKSGEYDAAITVLDRLTQLSQYSITSVKEMMYIEYGEIEYPHGSFGNAILNSEISRLLLVILLRPCSQHPNLKYKKILAMYEEDKTEPPIPEMSFDLFSLLQSFWIAVSENDQDGLKMLQFPLEKYLSSTELEITHQIYGQETNIY